MIRAAFVLSGLLSCTAAVHAAPPVVEQDNEQVAITFDHGVELRFALHDGMLLGLNTAAVADQALTSAQTVQRPLLAQEYGKPGVWAYLRLEGVRIDGGAVHLDCTLLGGDDRALFEEEFLFKGNKEQARAQDGITGRAQWLRDPREGTRVLGRFGWKAETATVEQQALDAALNDMGVTSGRFPHQPCTEAQRACREARHGGSVDAPELTAEQAEALVVYLQLLGVPARRDLDEPQVRRGEAAFSAAGCASCHVPELRTGGHDIERLNGQTIRPYTDLLLHDMGPGLADGRPSHEASGREWRTAPLWGIGLVPTVNGHSRYLHDGRARSLEEAVLWHGGEAEAAKLRFMQMSREERDALLRFLNSL